jgi:hypothetical protein
MFSLKTTLNLSHCQHTVVKIGTEETTIITVVSNNRIAIPVSK